MDNNIMMRKERKEDVLKIFIGISFFLMLFFTVFTEQVDTNTITKWAYDFLKCIFNNNLKDFPRITYDNANSFACNYSLLVNVIHGVWLLPIYLIERCLKMHISFEIYKLWYRFFVLIISVICSACIFALTKYLKKSKEEQLEAVLLWQSSVVLCGNIILHGQTESLEILFFLLGALFIVRKQYFLMGIMFALSVIVKPYIFLIEVPLVLLLIGIMKLKNITIAGIIAIGLYIFEKILTYALMPEYFEYGKIMNQYMANFLGKTFAESFFEQSQNNIFIFMFLMILLCAVCLYWGVNQIENTGVIIGIPFLSFVFMQLFVGGVSYHFLIVYLCFIGFVIYEKDKILSRCMIFVLNFIMFLRCYFTMESFESYGSRLIFHFNRHINIFNGGTYREFLRDVCNTIIWACVVLTILALTKYDKKNKYVLKETETLNIIVTVLQVLPSILFALIIIVECI